MPTGTVCFSGPEVKHRLLLGRQSLKFLFVWKVCVCIPMSFVYDMCSAVRTSEDFYMVTYSSLEVVFLEVDAGISWRCSMFTSYAGTFWVGRSLFGTSKEMKSTQLSAPKQY